MVPGIAPVVPPRGSGSGGGGGVTEEDAEVDEGEADALTGVDNDLPGTAIRPNQSRRLSDFAVQVSDPRRKQIDVTTDGTLRCRRPST